MLDKSSKKPLTHSSELNKGTATFADNVLALTAGSAIAFGVSILASPITSRLYGPEEFGLAALFISGAMVLWDTKRNIHRCYEVVVRLRSCLSCGVDAYLRDTIFITCFTARF